MSVVNITLQLPEELAERATAAGLLSSEQVSAWLEAELSRKEHLKLLQADLERLRAVSEPLGDDEVTALVDEEIHTYRAEKRSSHSRQK
jgi:post-segregation antitoxin (ccd killing protein)